MSASPIAITLPPDLIADALRAEIAARLPSIEDLRRTRLELLLTLATIDAAGAADLLGITPRRFVRIARQLGIPAMPFGHRTVRYRIADISTKLDTIATSASKDLSACRRSLLSTVQSITDHINLLAA